MFEDVAQEIIDNEFNGMEAIGGFSEPMTDLDFSSEQP
jgi:hypothetical protein|tara:strand:- start:1819 stop:1932 length:114 start_codon:yes stop_codon:yes gene_type:complete